MTPLTGPRSSHVSASLNPPKVSLWALETFPGGLVALVSVALLSLADNVDDPTGNFRSGPLTGWKVFLLLLCALLGIIVCAVVGAVVFQKRQERNKRFY